MRLLSPHFSAWHFPLGTFDNFQLFTKVTEPVEVHFQLNYQERQDELGLNWDSFKYRNYDYAIGRFMSVDPLAEKYAYNSTYAFQENKMGLGRELEGLELVIRDENTGAISKGPYDTNNNNITEVQINKEGWSEELPAVEITAHYNQDNNDQQNLNLTPKGMVDVQPQLQQWDGKIRYKGFGKLKEYGFFGNAIYSMANGYNLTTQVLFSPLFPKKYENPLTGRKAFVNLDGSPHYKPPVEEFVTTVLPQLAETKFLKFSKLNASQFSSKFKGGFLVRQPHKIRGFFNRSYNYIGTKISNKLTSSSLIKVIKLATKLKKED